jgi:glycosyltransferase involved in cell wall biosynthesis
MPDASVVICTWNRAPLLDQALTQLRALEAPPGVSWELLVVNNNCTDDTDAVITRHAPALPVRRLFEGRPGKSHAANLAVAEAQGGLVLWTDDDVLVEPDWLAQYVRAAAAWPDAAFFGGVVEPHFAAEPPDWIRRHLARLQLYYAACDYGGDERPFLGLQRAVGANLAFRADVLKRYRFDTHFGPRAEATVGGGMEENLIQEAVIRDGHQGVWIPAARVRHVIPAARLTARFIWQRHRDEVRFMIRRYGLPDMLPIDGFPRWDLPLWPLPQDGIPWPQEERGVLWFRRHRWEALVRARLRSPWKDDEWLTAFLESACWKGILQELRAAQKRQAEADPAWPAPGMAG